MDELKEAQEHRIARFTVALGPTLPRRPREVKFASGVLVSWQKRNFIVTADHFVKRYHPDAIMVLFPTESSNFIDDPTKSKSRVRPMRVRPGKNPFHPRFGAVVSNAADDIVALELIDELPRGSEGYEIEKCIEMKIQLRHGDRVIVSGYPSSLAQLFPGSDENKIDVGRMPVQLDTVALYEDKPERWTDGFTEGKNIAVLFDPKQTELIGFTDPEGLSGGGVWQLEANATTQPGIWLPFPQLLGIQVSWLEGQKRSKVTLIKAITDLLKTMS